MTDTRAKRRSGKNECRGGVGKGNKPAVQTTRSLPAVRSRSLSPGTRRSHVLSVEEETRAGGSSIHTPAAPVVIRLRTCTAQAGGQGRWAGLRALSTRGMDSSRRAFVERRLRVTLSRAFVESLRCKSPNVSNPISVMGKNLLATPESSLCFCLFLTLELFAFLLPTVVREMQRFSL